MDYSVKEDIIDSGFVKFLQSNILLYCVVLLLFLKVGVTLVSINFPENIFFADITRSALENFVNETRQSAGLQPLTQNAKLDQAAQLKAENMVQNNYFDHTSPSGVSPWHWFLQAGYNYKYAGENLAIGFFDSQEVYNAWLNSPEHKANIVNSNYTEVGTAVLKGFGQNNTIVVVQEFGSQLPVKKPVAATKNNNLKPVATQVQPISKNIAPVAIPVAINEKVLAQSTEPKNYLKPFLPDYNNLLQDIIYGLAIVVIGILLTLIFIDPNFKKELVFRAVIIVILLSAATLINSQAIILLIPHRVII